MQKRIAHAAIFFVALITLLVAEQRVAAQQLIDPAPVDDKAIELELPPPERSLIPPQQVAPPPVDRSHAFLGVTFDPNVHDAAVARSVSAGSPADQAGVKAGDTIIALNGRKTGTYDDVLKTVAALKPGDVLDIEVSRRISLRARAVLEGQPIGSAPVDGRRMTGYRPLPEALPAPLDLRQSPRPQRPPVNANTAQPRQNYQSQPNRNGAANRNEGVNRNRNNGANDDDRGRRLRRRRG